MKRWCLDTSALSNPWQDMPEDIYERLWVGVKEILSSGVVAVTTEIYNEMTHINGSLGECIKANQANLLLEVGDGNWDFINYAGHVKTLQQKHHSYISEYCGGRKGTVGLNDITIVALAKTLGLPVVSMEKFIVQPEAKNKRIPNICSMEGVRHLDFNEFLRSLGMKL